MDNLENERFIAMLNRLVTGYEKNPVYRDGTSAEDFTIQVCCALREFFEGVFYVGPNRAIICHLITGKDFEIQISGL